MREELSIRLIVSIERTHLLEIGVRVNESVSFLLLMNHQKKQDSEQQQRLMV